jgi:DNA-binding winged helix-turn-helix (wHTH) protein
MSSQTEDSSSDWFRALLDGARDVYFRYALTPVRRLAYVSPSIETLTGHAAQAFYDDRALCLSVVSRADRRLLRQVLRARRGLKIRIHVMRGDARIPVEIRTVAVVRARAVVAIEGVARPISHDMSNPMVDVSATSGLRAVSRGARSSRPAIEPSETGVEGGQRRLTALLCEVHDLLHRALPDLVTGECTASTRCIRVGDLTFDDERLLVDDGGVPVVLPGRELMLLRYLLQRAGRVVTRAQLLAEVWGYQYTGDARTVDVHVSRLRKKLPSLRARLVTIKHLGYRLDAEDTREDLAG